MRIFPLNDIYVAFVQMIGKSFNIFLESYVLAFLLTP